MQRVIFLGMLVFTLFSCAWAVSSIEKPADFWQVSSKEHAQVKAWVVLVAQKKNRSQAKQVVSLLQQAKLPFIVLADSKQSEFSVWLGPALSQNRVEQWAHQVSKTFPKLQHPVVYWPGGHLYRFDKDKI